MRRYLTYKAVTRPFEGPDVYEVISTRARRLEVPARDAVFYGSGGSIDHTVRRYLVRPAKGTFDYILNEGMGPPSEMPMSLDLGWTLEAILRDGDRWFDVRGVGFYDSAGRMLELTVRNRRALT